MTAFHLFQVFFGWRFLLHFLPYLRCVLKWQQNLDLPIRKDTPSLIDVKGLRRPKELTGGEEDFQQWSKKTEASFAGVIKESEMMLEVAAEQPTENTTTATDANEDRSAKPGVRAAADAHSTHGSHEL